MEDDANKGLHTDMEEAADKARGRKGTPITCLETGMTFPTVKAAAAWARRSPANISNCLSGRCATSAGYHWVYADAQPSSWRVPVACRESLETFSDIASAAAWAGCTPSRISSCLAGRSKTAGGHLWAAVANRRRAKASK